jgi:NAD(P)H-quinone oxidoreductase subunit 4L
MNESATIVSTSSILVIGGAALFWIGMLGLLWRRSLVGMLVGVLFAWISVAVVVIGFGLARTTPMEAAMSGVLVLGVVTICCLQIAVGLGVVMARIRRRGTLDADDAGLLEG